MSIKWFLLCSAFSVQIVFSPAFAEMSGCDAKKMTIRTQIEDARIHGNTHHVAGLEKALSEVNEHCNETELAKEKKQKVEEKTHKVEQRQREYEEAKRDGQSDKVAKKLRKLNEAKEELAEANSTFNP